MNATWNIRFWLVDFKFRVDRKDKTLPDLLIHSFYTMIFKLNILLISISTIAAASSFDEINKLNPQIPSSSNPSRNGNYGGSEFFTSSN